jgi:hypothetical protein
MIKRTIQVLLVLTVFVLSACGAGAVTSGRVSSARQVVATLDRAGLRCTGASYSNPPGVSGATSEVACYRNGGNTEFFIDVFPGTVTTATVLRDSVSTGTEKIWSDVGPNWWVQTTHSYAERIQKAIGGRIVGGPWNPQPAAPAPPDPLTTWQDGRGYGRYQAVETALKRVGADAGAGNAAAISADGKALFKAALAAEEVPCPADRSGYKLEMTSFAAAGIALQLNKISLAGKYIQNGSALTSSVNAVCGF